MIDFHYNLVSQPDGSAQKVLKTLLFYLRGWEKMGIGVSHSKKMESNRQRGVSFYAIPEKRTKNWVWNKILGLKLFTYDGMVELLNRERPDILHFHNRHELVDKLCERLDYSPKVVCQYHKPFKKPVFPKSASLFLGVSNYLAERLKKQIDPARWELVHPLPNPIPYDLLALPRAQFKLLSYPLNILFPFGDDPEKGFPEVVEAMRELEKRNYRVIFHIAGKIKSKSLNLAGISKFRLYGYLPPDEYYQLLSKMDFLVLPTKREAFSLVVLEAIYFGVRVVATPTGGVPEVLGKNYPCFSHFSAESIVSQILKGVTLPVHEWNSIASKIIAKAHPSHAVRRLSHYYEALLRGELLGEE
jgi:glycosyltransferase involved in cell wall biosynthesis